MHVEKIVGSCRLRVSLHGPLLVHKRTPDGGWQPVSWEGKLTRSLLRRLLVAPGRRASRLQLADDLWAECEEGEADTNVYPIVSLLRSAIGKALVTTYETGYQVAGQELIWVDLDAADLLLKQAENQGYTSLLALPWLEEALRYLERGAFLEGETGRWRYGFQEPSERLLKRCRLWLAENHEARGNYWQAGEHYRMLSENRPTDEEALQRWMRLLARQGLAQQALSAYRRGNERARAQGESLSALTDQLAAHIKQQEALPPIVIATSTPLAQASALWLFDMHTPERASRLAAWSALLPTEEEEVAKAPEIVYVSLEVEILALALRWSCQSDSLLDLQTLVYATIRKHDAMHNDPMEPTADMTRRHALQAIALFPMQLYGLSLFSVQERTPPAEILPLCAAGLTACIELRKYEPEGMQAIQRILATYLPALETLARQSSPTQSPAAALAAQGYLLVSVLADHSGKLDQMEAASRLARFYAQIAHDPNLEVSALVRQAIMFDVAYRDIQALQSYQEALALPTFRSVSPLLQGRVYAGLAGTHSYCEHVDDALYFLGLAHDTYPASPEDDPSFAFAFSNSDTLSCWAGLTYKYTGQYQEAKDAFLRVGGLTPVPGLLESKRGEHLNYVASVAVKQHDRDAALLYLDAAEEIAWTVKHKQRYVEVCNTLRSMRLLWPDEPGVKTLQEKIYARQYV